MIPVSKEECEVLRKHLPSAHIHRTVKQKSKRHKYFVEESHRVMAILSKLRKHEDTAVVK